MSRKQFGKKLAFEIKFSSSIYDNTFSDKVDRGGPKCLAQFLSNESTTTTSSVQNISPCQRLRSSVDNTPEIVKNVVGNEAHGLFRNRALKRPAWV